MMKAQKAARGRPPARKFERGLRARSSRSTSRQANGRLRLRLPRGHRAHRRSGRSTDDLPDAGAACSPPPPCFPVRPGLRASRARSPCGSLTEAQDGRSVLPRPGTPLRASLVELGSKAPRLAVTGQVPCSARCAPGSQNALLDFWHAGRGRGSTTNAGFRYRGHQFTGRGRAAYRLATIVPAEYPGNGARHIHVKGAGPGKARPHDAALFPGRSGATRRTGSTRRAPWRCGWRKAAERGPSTSSVEA